MSFSRRPAPPKSPVASTDSLGAEIQRQRVWVDAVKAEMARALVGQQLLVDRLLVGILTNGHVLLEGVPGLAKTLTIRSLAGCLSVDFRRVQFTPDLLPADLIGTMIYNPQAGEFRPKLGPIFANLILADEINRAPAKVQSALLEAMAERQVTLAEKTWKLPDPFLVLATQNPIDQEGTYQLPEAQLDRFLLKVTVGYPSPQEERQILDMMGTSAKPPETRAIIEPGVILESRALVNQVYIDDSIKDYIVNLIQATRHPQTVSQALTPLIRAGASPRGTINLTLAARARAYIAGRGYVIPQDIKDLAFDVLRHRILLTYEAEAEGVTSEQVIQEILNHLPVP
ncbi:MAG: MoxR family ATPase [Verrucomicrobia bacterium]|nr:MoxR family ATPase [Verrucomicrobiota bacterium]